MSFSNQNFPNQGFPSSYYPPPPQQKSGNSGTLWIVLAVLGGGALLLGGACCGGVIYFIQPPVASAAATQPFELASIPVPPLPERGPPDLQEPGILWHEIKLGSQEGGYYDTPGHGGYMYLYLPEGEHSPGSLPCILHTGAGTNLLSGVELGGEGNPPEYFPYVKAGYAVLVYEMDGPSTDDEDAEAMRASYDAFKAARAGLVNARNAFEYATQKVPEVNPARIYASGHSSAATHALLFAAHEPRLAGVIAFAPGLNLEKRFGPAGVRAISLLMPGAVDFIKQSDPMTHASRLTCPTLLFHAQDDSNCPIADTQELADKLKAQGTEVTLITVPTGDHYDSMIEEGLPAGVRWLQEKAK
jgi:dipeptidyl aminopeptidase/acylaminoacyl peptidase